MPGPGEAMFLIPFLVPLGAIAFFGWLALRFVRAKEQGNLPVGPSASRAELGRIEDTLETLQREVQGLQERQAFVEKLLEGPRDQR